MKRRRGGAVRITTIVFMMCAVTGCAAVLDRPSGPSTFPEAIEPPPFSDSNESATDAAIVVLRSAGDVISAQPALNEPIQIGKQERKPRKQAEKEKPPEEELYDPFATEEDRLAATAEEYDPWEPFNTVMFEFNRKVDKYVLKPVATAYEAVLPDQLELGIRNAFHNIRFVPRMLNNLFQGKLKGAGLEMGRFLVNSTLGLAGFFDFAKNVFGMETPDEDLGQTLGWYGVKPGPYLVLPFLPPFTLRDAIGYTGDIFLNPFNYLVLPLIEIDGAPSLIDHTDRDTTTILQLGIRVGEVVNERALNLDTFEGVEEATIDLYGAVRNAYLQRRARQIRE